MPGTAFGDVVDPVDGDLAEPALRSLRRAGRFVTVGYVAGGRVVGKMVLDVSAPVSQWPDRAGTTAST